MTSSEEIRVGVYICHCGGNISDVVDVKQVAESLKSHPMVKVATNYMFMCSEAGQNMIIDDIQKNHINRVVVSACAPSLHEKTFREVLKRAGINPHFYENVNIREQVSWVHKGKTESATAKAIRLTRAGVEKIVRQSELQSLFVEAEQHVAVIGAGIAGLRAATALAQRGLGVTLIERSDRVGGRLLEMNRIYPTGDAAIDIVHSLAKDVFEQPKIDVLLNANIESVDGYVGDFSISMTVNDERRTVKAGAIVLATGFDHYIPRDGEWGYRQSPKVVTLPELWSMMREKRLGNAKHIAFLHCVGSRQTDGLDSPQPDGKVNDYCSRVCCTAGLHAIEELLDQVPNVRIYDVYKDIRTYGRGHEDIYERASKRGVLFFRYADGEKPEWTDGKLKVRDMLTWGEEVEIPVDLLVLVTGMMPRNIKNLIDMMKLPVGVDRFLQEVHPKLKPVELANRGVLVAGTCQGPMDIGESCASAEAAASKIAILLAKGRIELDPFVATVDPTKCDGCGLCLNECEYPDVLTMVDGAEGDVSKAHVNSMTCKGCGACAAVCPTRAIHVAGWSIDQYDAMVDALVAGVEYAR